MTAEITTVREGEGRRTFPVLAQQVKQYLADLGVDAEIDFEMDILYVVSVSAPLNFIAPRREGGLVLRPGDVVYV